MDEIKRLQILTGPIVTLTINLTSKIGKYDMIHFRHQRSSLGDTQLIALNSVDLLTCVFSFANIFCFNEYTKKTHDILPTLKQGGPDPETSESFTKFLKTWQVTTSFPLQYLSLFSSFITAMLSVTRTVVLARPLCVIKKRAVYLAFVIYFFFSFTLFVITCILFLISNKNKADKPDWLDLEYGKFSGFYLVSTMVANVVAIIAVLVVWISSLIAIRSLKNPPEMLTRQTERREAEASRNATVVILTLSCTFVTCNGIWSLWWVVLTVAYFLMEQSDYFLYIKLIGLYVNFLLITLNSSVNPLVYLIKNSAMNAHTKTLLRGLQRYVASKFEIFRSFAR